MFKTKTISKNIDESQLSHTKWNCMYHIVFIPKYRRKAIYGKLKRDIGIYLRRLCEYKSVEIVEAHACTDHIHMLVKIPPKLSVSQFMGYLLKNPFSNFDINIKIPRELNILLQQNII